MHFECRSNRARQLNHALYLATICAILLVAELSLFVSCTRTPNDKTAATQGSPISVVQEPTESVQSVLEFYSAIRPSTRDSSFDVNALRKSLSSGTRADATHGTLWLPIEDLDLWLFDAKEESAFNLDPIAYFARTFDAALGVQNDKYFILVYDRNTDQNAQWNIMDASLVEDALGFPSVDVKMDKSGQQLLESRIAKTGRIAVVVDGKVFSIANEPPWIVAHSFSATAKRKILGVQQRLRAMASNQ